MNNKIEIADKLSNDINEIYDTINKIKSNIILLEKLKLYSKSTTKGEINEAININKSSLNTWQKQYRMVAFKRDEIFGRLN